MCWLAITTVILFLLFLSGFSQKDDNFGPYTMEWLEYDLCKGPKPKECGQLRIQSKQNLSDVVFALDFTKDCPMTKAKITVSTEKNNVVKKILSYPINKPCEHFVLGPFFLESFNISSNCKIKKGKYTVHLNMNQKASLFLGKSFFYGTYIFKVTTNNENENFFCIKTKLVTEKA